MKDNKLIKLFMVMIVITGIFMLYAVIMLLPELVEFSIVEYSEIAYLARPVKYIVLVSALPFFIVLLETLKLCKYILGDEIYSLKPLMSLKVISYSSLIICMIFLVVMLLFIFNNYFTPLLAIILFLVILSSFIIGIFSRILLILVKNATKLKEDNDLTI